MVGEKNLIFWIYYLYGNFTLTKYFLFFLLFFSFSQLLSSQVLSNPKFDNAKKDEINDLIKNYILENPEIIIEAIEIFQKKQSLNALKKEKEIIKSLSG